MVNKKNEISAKPIKISADRPSCGAADDSTSCGTADDSTSCGAVDDSTNIDAELNTTYSAPCAVNQFYPSNISALDKYTVDESIIHESTLGKTTAVSEPDLSIGCTVDQTAEISVPAADEAQGILFYLQQKRERIWEIDFLRGFCILLMIFDHIALMLWMYFGPEWYGGTSAMFSNTTFGGKLCTLCYTYWFSELRAVGHPIVLFIFFAISGISCAFSRSNLKRGIGLAIVALLYTLVTYIIDETLYLGCFTSFGVLHFYAFCILTWSLICALCRSNIIARSAVSFCIVVTVLLVYHLYTAPSSTPEWLFFVFPHTNLDGSNATFYSQSSVSPGDLFNLIPWASFFFTGTMLQPLLYGKKRSLLPKLNGAWNRPFCFLGRHALPIYILHVVVIAVLLAVISKIAFGVWGLF